MTNEQAKQILARVLSAEPPEDLREAVKRIVKKLEEE